MKYKKPSVIVRFHEIALKGKNRPFFVNKLAENLNRANQGNGIEAIWRGPMMVGLTLRDETVWPAVRECTRRVFGVAKFRLGYRLSRDLDVIKHFLRENLAGRCFSSFRITTRRTDKQFAMDSMAINMDLGAFVKEVTSANVDLGNPELEIVVDVLPREIIVSFDEVKGQGGLPVGSSGQVAALLSGGIDSPVAAWRLMKRGCRVVFIHFHSFPLVDSSSMEKASELVHHLTRYQYSSSLLLVPFGELQKRLILSVPPENRIVLYRRFMVRIAESLAKHNQAKALVTGESLGQVSSQTLENLITINQVASMPILRPLIGLDKQEIIDMARSIGTYELSILPDQDCCTLFIPRHPNTKSNPAEMASIEANLPVEEMVREAIEMTSIREFNYP